jgi:formamidopyrimidine-DNA glycosylase
MPELPEVETVRKSLLPCCQQKILKVEVHNPRLRWPIAAEFSAQIRGKNLNTISRRGKYLQFHLDNGDQWISHLGMSGYFYCANTEASRKKHDHVSFHFQDFILRYNDTRRFGSMFFLAQGQTLPLLENLGVEPLSESWNKDTLWSACQNKNKPIKQIIMDAKIVVGIGNIYANESLFHAKIHPQTAGKKLSSKQCASLVQQSRQILKKAIDQGGTTLKDFQHSNGKPGYFTQSLQVYGRENQACQTCNTAILKTILAGRATYCCPQCQPCIT